MDRRNKSPFYAATPATRLRWRSPLARGAARRWLVLDTRLRMGEGSASEVAWGEGPGRATAVVHRSQRKVQHLIFQFTLHRAFHHHVQLLNRLADGQIIGDRNDAGH